MKEKILNLYKYIVSFLIRHRMIQKILIGFVLVGLIGMVFYSVLFAAPAKFPEQALVHIKKGTTLSEAAKKLQSAHIIHNARLFEIVAHAYADEGTIVAGEYSFTSPQNVLTVARRLTTGDFELAPIRIRVVEGMSVAEITKVLEKNLVDFDAKAFFELALPKEGRLFPDTYFFFPGDDPELVLETMESNFNARLRDVPLAAAITAFGEPLHDVLVMASILEKEAATTQDRRIIAGILWRRIEDGMPLQVDAVFPYIIGKNTYTLTRADLQTDSPYNTYRYKGLPPGPIGSPSIDSILAAVTPLTTSYVYYLSDREGVTHYSTTYEQHLAKKRKYIDNQ
jgi:UPF0755 protein